VLATAVGRRASWKAVSSELDEKLAGKLLNRLRDGEDPSVLIAELVDKGHSRKRATRSVEALDDQVQAEQAGVVVRRERPSKFLIWFGALVMLTGMAGTVISYESAKEGGSYFVLTGLIIGGLSMMLNAARGRSS